MGDGRVLNLDLPEVKVDIRHTQHFLILSKPRSSILTTVQSEMTSSTTACLLQLTVERHYAYSQHPFQRCAFDSSGKASLMRIERGDKVFWKSPDSEIRAATTRFQARANSGCQ